MNLFIYPTFLPSFKIDMNRETKYACWTDPDVPLERMSGSVWSRALKDEEMNLAPALKESKKEIDHYINAYGDVKLKTYKYRLHNTIDVVFNNRFSLSWVWSGCGGEILARSVFVSPCGAYVLSVEDDGDGSEDFTLTVYDVKTHRMVWFIPHVGETVGIVDGTVYYTKVENKLWNSNVGSCNLTNGKSIQGANSPFGLPKATPEQNYGIERGSDGLVYISLEDSQKFYWWRVLADGKLAKSTDGPYRVPTSWILPRGEYGIDKIWHSQRLLVTKTHGSKTLWQCSAHSPPKKLMEIPAGFIAFDPDNYYSVHLEMPKMISFIVAQPNTHLTHYKIVNDHIIRVGTAASMDNGLSCDRQIAISEDGTRVHYILLKSKKIKTPHRLLISAYGAYGMETPTGMLKERWGPLLENGWAVAVGFLRGGGDHNQEWARAGQLSGRKKTFQDMEAVIRSAQNICHVGADQSCIYGRSAGGYLVGALLGRNPEGALFKAVYTEVPYVDVLQTTTNASLPLTRIEYGEFGNPRESLSDFIFIGLSSPAMTAAAVPCPNIFVLARTALNDSQVFPYETIKWIRRLRTNDKCRDGKPAGKYAIVEGDQGHFTPPDKSNVQHGIDAGLLANFLNKRGA